MSAKVDRDVMAESRTAGRAGAETTLAGERPRPVRFGVLVASPKLAAWQARCLRRLTALPGVRPVVVMQWAPPGAGGTGGRSTPAHARDGVVDRLFSAWVDRRLPRSLDSAEVLRDVPRLTCRLQRGDDGTVRIPDADVETLEGLDLDFLLDLEFERLGGRVLRASHHGVWSIRHGNPGKATGGPPGFWELYDGDPVLAVALERLVDGATGVVLRQGWFKALKHSYTDTLRATLEGCSAWPAQVCDELRDPGHDGFDAAAPSTPPAQVRRPSSLQVLRLGVGVCRSAFGLASRALLRHEVWNLGVSEGPIEALLASGVSPRIRWLPEVADGKFLADPFPVPLDGRLHVLCEEFDYRSYRGRIVSVEVTDEGALLPPTPAMDLGIHLSYPFVVVRNGAIYCVPEAVDSQEISLYKAVDFPGRWEKVAVLVDGFPGVDNTVFRHEGRWWLAATNFQEGKQDTLWLWHARDLAGPWRPHEGNPVKTDVRSARSGGTPFMSGGHLYRPAQDCSMAYGGRVVINRLDELTPGRFRETPVASVEPDRAGGYPDGLHTLSAAGDRTIVDGRRHAFVGAAARHTFRMGVRSARLGARGFAGRSAMGTS